MIRGTLPIVLIMIAFAIVADAHPPALEREQVPVHFARVVQACAAASFAPGDVVHIDATLILAEVSFDASVERHLDAVDAARLTEENRLARMTGRFKQLCTTDPDATMATRSRKQRLQPACKQHTAVDGAAGIIVDVEIATGKVTDFGDLREQRDATARLGRARRASSRPTPRMVRARSRLRSRRATSRLSSRTALLCAGRAREALPWSASAPTLGTTTWGRGPVAYPLEKLDRQRYPSRAEIRNAR